MGGEHTTTSPPIRKSIEFSGPPTWCDGRPAPCARTTLPVRKEGKFRREGEGGSSLVVEIQAVAAVGGIDDGPG